MKATTHDSTPERLLDTAERLFAEFGYDGVGMRTLAEEAEVNLGAATYHFGSKENLYKETFLRRFKLSLERRMELLDEAERNAAGKPIALERILEAMLRPPFETGRKHPHFARLMARNIFAPPPFMEALIGELTMPQNQRIAAEIRRAEPTIPLPLLWNRLQMTAGALLFTASRPFSAVLEGPQPSDEEQLADLIRYATHGLRQAANPES